MFFSYIGLSDDLNLTEVDLFVCIALWFLLHSYRDQIISENKAIVRELTIYIMFSSGLIH